MSWPNSIAIHRLFGGPPERRTDSQIDDDLEDEFAFHLAMKERELMNEGHDREAAGSLARSAFGDIESIKLQCRRMALEERIMLQRVNLVMMIVVLLIVVGVGVQVMLTQRYNTLALQDITTQIAKMKFDAASAERAVGTISSANSEDKVVLEGDLERPGWYAIQTSNGATFLQDLLGRAGLQEREGSIVLYHNLADTGGRTYDLADLLSNGSKVILRPNDRVKVISKSTLQEMAKAAKAKSTSEVTSNAAPRFGKWAQVNESGQLIDDGLVMEMIPPNDLRYRTLSGRGSLDYIAYVKLPKHEVRMSFNYDYGVFVSLDDRLGHGRWTREGDQVIVDVHEILPEQSAPWRFVRVDKQGE